MTDSNIIAVSQAANPFPGHAIERDAAGVRRYTNLPDSPLDMLGRHVTATPDVEAVVEIDGPRLSYRELWDRAARVAGGLRAQGLESGDHVTLRYPSGVDWVLGFWGAIMAGGIPVAVNTRFTVSEVAYVLGDAGARFDSATDISALRWIGYGGAPIAASLVTKIKTAFPGGQVFNGFGMTETASLITSLPDRDAAEHADSVGYAVPVIDLAIDAFENSDSGELLVRGPNVTRGYWNRDSSESIKDGWLCTGDVVRADAAGRIHIIDRAKDIINRGGENVSSIEVEAALADAPNVAEAAALPVPDDVMGEKVGVVLVAESGALDLQAVLAHARERLADYKVPQYASIQTTPLARNAAGKLLKTRLRETVHWGEPLR